MAIQAQEQISRRRLIPVAVSAPTVDQVSQAIQLAGYIVTGTAPGRQLQLM
jgi:hypothetical protein